MRYYATLDARAERWGCENKLALAREKQKSFMQKIKAKDFRQMDDRIVYIASKMGFEVLVGPCSVNNEFEMVLGSCILNWVGDFIHSKLMGVNGLDYSNNNKFKRWLNKCDKSKVPTLIETLFRMGGADSVVAYIDSEIKK